MRQHAERLSQRPLRKGVGGIALVIDREGRFKAVIHQIGIEIGDLFGQHHAFVDDRPAGQRTEIQARNLCCNGRLFGAATDDVQLAFELFLIDVLFTADQDLFNLGPGRIGLVTQHSGIHRDMPPAIYIVAHAQNFGLNDRPAGFLRAEISAGHEHLTDGNLPVGAGFVAGTANLIFEKPQWNLDMDARAIASLAVSVDSAAVPDGFQCRDTFFDDAARWGAVNGDHKADTARGVFVIGLIKRILGHPSAAGFFGYGPFSIIDGHGRVPSCANCPVHRANWFCSRDGT